MALMYATYTYMHANICSLHRICPLRHICSLHHLNARPARASPTGTCSKACCDGTWPEGGTTKLAEACSRQLFADWGRLSGESCA